MSRWPRPKLSIMAVLVPFVILYLVLIVMEAGRAA